MLNEFFKPEKSQKGITASHYPGTLYPGLFYLSLGELARKMTEFPEKSVRFVEAIFQSAQELLHPPRRQFL
jgi:hypothetical protein